jgi:hypothetical protein
MLPLERMQFQPNPAMAGSREDGLKQLDAVPGKRYQGQLNVLTPDEVEVLARNEKKIALETMPRIPQHTDAWRRVRNQFAFNASSLAIATGLAGLCTEDAARVLTNGHPGVFKGYDGAILILDPRWLASESFRVSVYACVGLRSRLVDTGYLARTCQGMRVQGDCSMTQQHACMATHRLAHGPLAHRSAALLFCLVCCLWLVDTHLESLAPSHRLQPPRAALGAAQHRPEATRPWGWGQVSPFTRTSLPAYLQTTLLYAV